MAGGLSQVRQQQKDDKTEIRKDFVKYQKEDGSYKGPLATSGGTSITERHQEILELAGEIIKASDGVKESDSKEVHPHLLRQWDSDVVDPKVENTMEPNAKPPGPIKQNRARKEITDEFSNQPSDVHIIDGSEISFRREEEFIENFPEVLMAGTRRALSVPEGDSIRSLVSQHHQTNVSRADHDNNELRLPLRDGEVSYRREETITENRGFAQPPRSVESGSTLYLTPFTQQSSRGASQSENTNTPTTQTGLPSFNIVHFDTGVESQIPAQSPSEHGLIPSQGTAFDFLDRRLRTVSDPPSPRTSPRSLGPLWTPQTPGTGGPIIVSTPPADTVLKPSFYLASAQYGIQHSLSSPALFTDTDANQDLHEHGSPRERRHIKHRERYDASSYTENDNGRERSPLLRRKHQKTENRETSITSVQILNEIEKLKMEHGKMMELLERSRKKRNKAEAAKSQADSPVFRLAGESDSSSGDSPVTVIRANSFNSGSTSASASPIATLDDLAQTSSPRNLQFDRAVETVEEISDRIRPIGVRGQANAGFTGAVAGHDISSKTTGTNMDVPSSVFISSSTRRDQVTHSDSQTTNTAAIDDEDDEDDIHDLLLVVPDINMNPPSAPSTTSFSDARTVLGKLPATTDAATDGASTLDAELKVCRRSSTSGDSSDDRHLKITGDEDSLSTISRGSNVSPLTLQAILDDDNDSAFSMSFLHSDRHTVSTGVEVSVDLSDEYTQTDLEGWIGATATASMDNSLLQASGVSSEGDSHDMSRIQRELDRLQHERIEIIELLSLQYLPSSLTIELLEAKLNYCIGQTDTLLASLEEAWGREDSQPKRPERLIKVTKEYLDEYKSQFNRTKKDIETCLETYQRSKTGGRGRRRTRGNRSFANMRRQAEMESFKLERLREQCRHEREMLKSRSASPSFSHSFDTFSTNDSFFADMSLPSHLTPSQRKEYLINLRRQLVHSSASDMAEMRRRTRSKSSSSDPDLYWAERPSSYSPARSESSGMYTTSTRLRTTSSRNHWSPSSHLQSRSFERSSNQSSPSFYSSPTPPRPRSSEPDLGGLTSDFRTNVVASYATRDLNADRLLEESNEIRRQNQRQIEQAQEVLKQLDAKRKQIKSQSRSSERGGSNSSTRSNTQSRQAPSDVASLLSMSSDSRMTAFSRDLAPEQTSSPRVPPSSFTLYARDHLVRGQRRLNNLFHTSPQGPRRQISPLARQSSPLRHVKFQPSSSPSFSRSSGRTTSSSSRLDSVSERTSSQPQGLYHFSLSPLRGTHLGTHHQLSRRSPSGGRSGSAQRYPSYRSSYTTKSSSHSQERQYFPTTRTTTTSSSTTTTTTRSSERYPPRDGLSSSLRDNELNLSGTPSSLLSTDLDLPDSDLGSFTSSPFSSTRPVSADDIKAKISEGKKAQDAKTDKK